MNNITPDMTIIHGFADALQWSVDSLDKFLRMGRYTYDLDVSEVADILTCLYEGRTYYGVDCSNNAFLVRRPINRS